MEPIGLPMLLPRASGCPAAAEWCLVGRLRGPGEALRLPLPTRLSREPDTARFSVWHFALLIIIIQRPHTGGGGFFFFFQPPFLTQQREASGFLANWLRPIRSIWAISLPGGATDSCNPLVVVVRQHLRASFLAQLFPGAGTDMACVIENGQWVLRKVPASLSPVTQGLDLLNGASRVER